jgi:phage gpG-like protein
VIGSKYDASEVFVALDLTRKRSTKLKQAFRTLSKPIKKDQAEHSKRKEGSRGKWPKLAQGTMRNRRQTRRLIKAAKSAPQASTKRSSRRNPARTLLGKLPRALKTTIGDLFIRIESTVPFGLVHQKGGRAGKRATMPAREFLWISKSAHKAAAQTLAEYLAKKFGKR